MKWPFWTRNQPVISDDCDSIDPLLSLYADGMASPAEAQRVTAHLPGCDSCRESLAWMQVTQRALAARPVVRPPADLRVRIAAAIAASSVPVSSGTRPARSFVLRPAYAAAASLAIFGIVSLSYTMRHEPPAANVHTAGTKPTTVAALPPVENALPNVKPTLPDSFVKPTVKQHSHRLVMPAPAKNNLVAMSAGDREVTSSPVEVKTSNKVHSTTAASVKSVTTIKLRIKAVRKPNPPSLNPAKMANTKIPAASVETHHPPVIQPEVTKPAPVVAEVPKQTPPAATIIAKPIVTQDTTARVASSHSDNSLSMVNDYARRLRTAAFKATVARSMSNAAMVVPTIDQDKKPGINTVSGNF